MELVVGHIHYVDHSEKQKDRKGKSYKVAIIAERGLWKIQTFAVKEKELPKADNLLNTVKNAKQLIRRNGGTTYKKARIRLA